MDSKDGDKHRSQASQRRRDLNSRSSSIMSTTSASIPPSPPRPAAAAAAAAAGEAEAEADATSPITTPSKPTITHLDLGLSTLLASNLDIKILCLSRFIRLFAYAGTTVILALHLSSLGNSDSRIGLFMTLTMVGDLLLSLMFTFTADRRFGRRNTLALGAAAVVASGIVFGISENYWVLLIAATVGVISPTANEIGPFRAIEESIIAHLTTAEERRDIYSWYSLIGIVGQAFGALACGALVRELEQNRHWSPVQAYRYVFFIYAGLGLVKLALTTVLSSKCEVDGGQKAKAEDSNDDENDEENMVNPEERPLLDRHHVKSLDSKSRLDELLGFQMTKDSARALTEVCFLTTLEAISVGLIVTSWISFYFSSRFGLAEGYLGVIFFVAYILQATSNVASAEVSKSFGVGKTMVLFNVLAAVFTALIPLPTESTSPVPAILFFLLRCSTNVIGLRATWIASMFLPAERTAFMGVTNVVRTLGSSFGPVITGAVVTANLFWLAFVLAAVVLLIYALTLSVLWRGDEGREKKATSLDDAEDESIR